MISFFLRRHHWLNTALVGSVAALTVLFSAGCKKKSAPPPPPAAMPVTVLTIKTEPVTLSQELPGRLSASRIAEVRARISGIVQKRLFTEGADVKEGDVLFQIDPAPYEAALDSAKATLARAEASLASAKVQAERFKDLVATNAVSKQNYDDAVARQLGFAADMAAGRAAVQTAEINLGYTRVTAPINGRIGRAEVTEGAYVQQTAATLLAVVQQLDPLYVDLTQSAEDVLRLKEALASGGLQRTAKGDAKVTVILNDGRAYGQPGALQFSDVSVNPTTGTVTVRATVPNSDYTLLPGMFVRARLEEGTDPSAILVPQSAVSRNARGDATVLVVGEQNKAAVRVLEASRSVGNRWLVRSGLKPGDQVIIDNLQKLRPGATVQPTPATDAAGPATPAAQPSH